MKPFALLLKLKDFLVNGRQAATGANNATSRIAGRPHQLQGQIRIGTEKR